MILRNRLKERRAALNVNQQEMVYSDLIYT